MPDGERYEGGRHLMERRGARQRCDGAEVAILVDEQGSGPPQECSDDDRRRHDE